MLRILLASGAELTAVPNDLLQEWDGQAVGALKRRLQSFCGQPRFRQRLLQGGSILPDNAALEAPADLQLVLLDFAEA